MATTIPVNFVGEPTITQEKLETIERWYQQALGNQDKAGEMDAEAYYAGAVDYTRSILELLYNMPVGSALARQEKELTL